MKQGFLLYNNEFFPANKPLFKVEDFTNLLFTERIRSLKNHLPFWDEHFQLMALKFKLHNIAEPHYLKEIKRQIERSLTKNKLFQNAEISLSFLNHSDNISYLIAVKELTLPDFNNGLIVEISDKVQKSISPLSAIAEGSRPFWNLSKNQTDLNIEIEILITNTQNCILEASEKNVFLIKENEIFTPSPSTGAYIDVSKKLVQHISEKIGLNFSEAEMLTKKDIVEADEIFLCNSIQGVQWVKGYKNKRYFCKIVRLINEEFNRALIQ